MRNRLLTLAAVCVLSLSACGSDDDNASSDAKTSSTEPPATDSSGVTTE